MTKSAPIESQLPVNDRQAASTDDKMCRVSRQNPCPICGKPDWCLVAPDGSAAICQRVTEGAVKKCGEAGWLHVLRVFGQK